MAIHKNERTVDGDSRCVEPWGGYLGAAFFLVPSWWRQLFRWQGDQAIALALCIYVIQN